MVSRLDGLQSRCRCRSSLYVPGIQAHHPGVLVCLSAGRYGNLHLVNEPIIGQSSHPVIGNTDSLSRISCRKFQCPGIPTLNAVLRSQVVRPILPLGWLFRYFRQERPVLKLHLQGGGRCLLGHFRKPDCIGTVARDYMSFVKNLFDVEGIFKGIESIIMDGHQLPPFHCFRAEDWDCSISLDRRSISDRYRSTEKRGSPSSISVLMPFSPERVYLIFLIG